MVWSVLWSAHAGAASDIAATTPTATTVVNLRSMRVLISGEGEGDGDVQPLGRLGDALVEPVLTAARGRLARFGTVGALEQAAGLLVGEDGAPLSPWQTGESTMCVLQIVACNGAGRALGLVGTSVAAPMGVDQADHRQADRQSSVRPGCSWWAGASM